MLGEIAKDDVSYSGDPSTSPISLDYYRTKAQEFQVVLQAIDGAYWAAQNALAADVSPELNADMQNFLNDFESHKFSLKLAAEGINVGAATINSLGGRFPTLNIPGALGIAPFAIPVAAIAAIAAAGTLAVWGVAWINGVNERLKREQILTSATPEQRAAIVASINASDNSIAQTNNSVWGALGNSIKWVAIAILGFFAYQAFNKIPHKRGAR